MEYYLFSVNICCATEIHPIMKTQEFSLSKRIIWRMAKVSVLFIYLTLKITTATWEYNYEERSQRGMALLNQTYKSVFTETYPGCLTACVHDSRCKSFNYWWHNSQCDLNNITKYLAGAKFFKRDSSSTYMGLLREPPVCKFDFEDGINDWEKTGIAFNNQPTYGDNTALRGSTSAGQQGDWWIGTYEDRPSKTAPAGNIQGDGPQGTLTSPFFNIRDKKISFLIGGGCDINFVRAELLIDGQAVRKDTGNCHETMIRKSWDVGAFIGQRARIRLVDGSSEIWNHINFDDVKDDISCEEY